MNIIRNKWEDEEETARIEFFIIFLSTAKQMFL